MVKMKVFLSIILISVIVCVLVTVCFRTDRPKGTNEMASTQETAESETTDDTVDTDETVTDETSDETENDENTDGLTEFKFAELTQGDEYQFSLVPLGTSWYEIIRKPMTEYHSYSTMDEDFGVNSADFQKYLISSKEYLLEGERFYHVCEFWHDELVDVILTFRSDKNAAEQFESFVAESTDLFGPESSRVENQKTGALTYTWQADKTRLKIRLDFLNDGTKDMTIAIGYTEQERDRVLAENIKESRELFLTAFKQEQDYQFGGVPWDASVEEVEEILNGNLKDVTLYAPKDFVFYDFKDIVYVLDGYEATASFEFRSDELVYISFSFSDLDDPKAFFEAIVSVFQDQYGTETEMRENKEIGYISYHWKTEITHLQTNFDGTMVKICVGTPKAKA